MAETGGSGAASANHQYTDPGFYTITVTVWDDDGASDIATIGEVFVFDPSTFVTGGGWVDSPQGTWTSEPSHTGKATFGFVVRYDCSGVVKGNLEFQLHNGLNLLSSGFDFLLINGGVATFEGWGTVNGDSGYGFVVVATDERLASGDEDLFWITVTGPGGTVYDGSTFPVQGLPIAGRGIQIHGIE